MHTMHTYTVSHCFCVLTILLFFVLKTRFGIYPFQVLFRRRQAREALCSDAYINHKVKTAIPVPKKKTSEDESSKQAHVAQRYPEPLHRPRAGEF